MIGFYLDILRKEELFEDKKRLIDFYFNINNVSIGLLSK